MTEGVYSGKRTGGVYPRISLRLHDAERDIIQLKKTDDHMVAKVDKLDEKITFGFLAVIVLQIISQFWG